MNDDAIYEQVAYEISSGNLKPGLMTKAYAQSKGIEEQAKAIYIDLRAKQIIQELQEVAAREAKRQKERLKEEKKELAKEHAQILGSIFVGFVGVVLLLLGLMIGIAAIAELTRVFSGNPTSDGFLVFSFVTASLLLLGSFKIFSALKQGSKNRDRPAVKTKF